MRTIAILPVKGFAHAKQRLRGGLSDSAREALVEAMLDDVLGALRRASVQGVLVITAGEAARKIALAHGADVLPDLQTGHNAAALLGIQAAIRDGFDRVLLVPGDCPALDPVELDQLLGRPVPARSILVVPDRHGTGTNALLLSPPDAIAPAFGPGSCQRHVRLAYAAGIAMEVLRLPSLALDIDTPEDLAALSAVAPRAPRTNAVMARC